jgi:hypothetical protein
VHGSPASRIYTLTRAQATEPIGPDTKHQIVLSIGFQSPVKQGSVDAGSLRLAELFVNVVPLSAKVGGFGLNR